MFKSSEHVFQGTTTLISSYDSTKTNFGNFIKQKTGPLNIDKFAGPMPIDVARPMEAPTAITCMYPHVIPYSSEIDWVFCTENTTAVNKRCVMYQFNKETSTFSWNGFVTFPMVSAGTHTTRAFRAIRDLYSTGQASISGTTVTGTDSLWQSSRIAVGARIGFGSTDPTQITEWFVITDIISNTSITVDHSGSISSTDYVIEEIRLIIVTTNSTLANGGLFLAKGLNPESFNPTGTTIPVATTVDNIRASYWLADASTVTNTVGGGVGLLDKEDWQTHDVFVGNGTTTMTYFKYNLRAALTVSSGKTTSAFVHKTGTTSTLTGTAQQLNSHRQGVLSHWQGGANCIFFATTTRIYYSLVSDLTDGNSSFLGAPMTENPPGGASTYALTNAMTSVELSPTLDRLYITTNSPRLYLTRFNTSNNQFDHILLTDDRQIDHSAADPGVAIHPTYNATVLSLWSEGGILYICRNGTTAFTNHIWAVPANVDWQYAETTNQRLITPSIPTPNAIRLSRCYTNQSNIIGSVNLGTRPEPFRAYVRTSGISDNTGTWIPIDDTGDLSSVSATNEVQIMYEFRILSQTCIPARIYSTCVIYEDQTSDNHFQPSANLSNAASKKFAWRFAIPFGMSVPPIRIKLFDATSGDLLVEDNSSAPTGTFEESTDAGQNWSSWTGTDKSNDLTYIRYSPVSLGDDIIVKAVLYV